MTVWDRENQPRPGAFWWDSEDQHPLGARPDFDTWASEVKNAVNSRIPIYDGLGPNGLGFEDSPAEPDDRVDVWLDLAMGAAAGFIVVCVLVLGVVALVRWRS